MNITDTVNIGMVKLPCAAPCGAPLSVCWTRRMARELARRARARRVGSARVDADHLSQRVDDVLRRLQFLERQLAVLVDVASPSDDTWLDRI